MGVAVMPATSQRRASLWSKVLQRHSSLAPAATSTLDVSKKTDLRRTSIAGYPSTNASRTSTARSSDALPPSSTTTNSVHGDGRTQKIDQPGALAKNVQPEQQGQRQLPLEDRPQKYRPASELDTSDASGNDPERYDETLWTRTDLPTQSPSKLPPPQKRTSRLQKKRKSKQVNSNSPRELDLVKPKQNPERSLRGGATAPARKDDEIADDGAPDATQTASAEIVEAALSGEARAGHYQSASDPEPMTKKKKEMDGSKPLTFKTTRREPKARLVDTDGSLRKRGRRKILLQKHLLQGWQLCLNGFCIFSTWWWMRYYYLLLPLITATVALNVAMVFSIVVRRTWNACFPEKTVMPESPESMVMLVPCYNETKEELVRSLDSLVSQRNIDDHKRAIIIVCDGKVRGPGMEKSTADYLLQDILTNRNARRYIKSAYTAWDQQPMNVVVQKGTYGGLPYYCIIKQQNQGKRDGLIVSRSFLYNFNRRDKEPTTIFEPSFFNDLAGFLIEDAGIDNVVHLIGMDADTIFDDDCIGELLKQSRYAKTMGVCGYVSVDWKNGHWNVWRLYQSAEYTIAQALRRLHQSLVTHKVSCLPGCCQLLRICEETCGDRVLLDLFGYCPDLMDGLLRQIRATASEDRNHVCHMLTARPESQTRQALFAKAYTDVPKSLPVLLSQRRRWTLGATSNDLLLATSRGVQWFERILATVNVSTWLLNPFIFASVASFIFAITKVPVWIVMCFVGVMVIPLAYCAVIPLWLCKRWRERVQFWVGFFMYIFCGPFINIGVLCYALIYLDSFGWGKTRKVIADDTTSASSSDAELDRLEKVEATSDTQMAPSQTGEHTSIGNGRIGSSAATTEGRDIADEERTIGF